MARGVSKELNQPKKRENDCWNLSDLTGDRQGSAAMLLMMEKMKQAKEEQEHWQQLAEIVSWAKTASACQQQLLNTRPAWAASVLPANTPGGAFPSRHHHGQDLPLGRFDSMGQASSAAAATSAFYSGNPLVPRSVLRQQLVREDAQAQESSPFQQLSMRHGPLTEQIASFAIQQQQQQQQRQLDFLKGIMQMLQSQGMAEGSGEVGEAGMLPGVKQLLGVHGGGEMSFASSRGFVEHEANILKHLQQQQALGALMGMSAAPAGTKASSAPINYLHEQNHNSTYEIVQALRQARAVQTLPSARPCAADGGFYFGGGGRSSGGGGGALHGEMCVVDEAEKKRLKRKVQNREAQRRHRQKTQEAMKEKEKDGGGRDSIVEKDGMGAEEEQEQKKKQKSTGEQAHEDASCESQVVKEKIVSSKKQEHAGEQAQQDASCEIQDLEENTASSNG